MPRICSLFVAFLFLLPAHLLSQHNAGQRCLSCHAQYSLGGTVYADYDGTDLHTGAVLTLYRSDGSAVTLPRSDADGRIWGRDIPDGRYLPRLGDLRARSWHVLPEQADCNACHLPGGNTSPQKDVLLRHGHTELPEDNDCTHCHHYPTSMHIARLHTPGTLNGAAVELPVRQSSVIVGARDFPFTPDEYTIRSVRPDIFAAGYFSFFDMLLAVADAQGIAVQYHWDDSCQTHFIDSFDGTTADFWYHFSYDAGRGTPTELRYRRQIRWDELLYQPGSSMQLVTGEDLAGLREAFKREIARERSLGHVVPDVRISITPSDFHGNPDGSGRITVSKRFTDVTVTAHDARSEHADSLYRRPFRAGVVTAMDLLYSLQDAGELSLVGRSYFTHLAGKVMESYRIRSIGFPDAGVAHASGRHGFVYTTGNGSFNALVNGADRKQHVHADIHVIHAPDFALWRWIELGNPYYEENDPTAMEEVLADYAALTRGFRLQTPWPQPASATLSLSVNVFTTASYRIEAFDLSGRSVAVLHDGILHASGVRRLRWDVPDLPSGSYILRCSDGHSVDMQRVQILH